GDNRPRRLRDRLHRLRAGDAGLFAANSGDKQSRVGALRLDTAAQFPTVPKSDHRLRSRVPRCDAARHSEAPEARNGIARSLWRRYCRSLVLYAERASLLRASKIGL